MIVKMDLVRMPWKVSNRYLQSRARTLVWRCEFDKKFGVSSRLSGELDAIAFVREECRNPDLSVLEPYRSNRVGNRAEDFQPREGAVVDHDAASPAARLAV